MDRSELDHSKPLLSFSFGQSAIFLLGGLQRDEAPTAMFMHSGDIMVMSGFSRLLNHAVPRVLPHPDGECLPHCLETPLPAVLPSDSLVEPCSAEDWQNKTGLLRNYTQRQDPRNKPDTKEKSQWEVLFLSKHFRRLSKDKNVA